MKQEDVATPIQQPQQEIERFIALQTERVRSDLEEKQKRQSKRLTAVLERTIVKKLKQKDAEIESIGKVNCALEDRVRSSPRPTRATETARRTPVPQARMSHVSVQSLPEEWARLTRQNRRRRRRVGPDLTFGGQARYPARSDKIIGPGPGPGFRPDGPTRAGS
ncbi:putative BOI-related E3 ubiquitin-protein ligase 2 [Nymphaea thermarum]|nr:putative BOI-related E3 ubiquitin-protein ligase 2 [Nymphaea thermarum]